MTVATPAQRPAETTRKPYPTRQREKPLASSIRSTFPNRPPHPELDDEHPLNIEWLKARIRQAKNSIAEGKGLRMTREEAIDFFTKQSEHQAQEALNR